MYPSLHIHSPPEGLLGCLRGQAGRYEWSYRERLCAGFCADVSFQLIWAIDKYQGVGLLGRTVTVCLAWKGIAHICGIFWMIAGSKGSTPKEQGHEGGRIQRCWKGRCHQGTTFTSILIGFVCGWPWGWHWHETEDQEKEHTNLFPTSVTWQSPPPPRGNEDPEKEQTLNACILGWTRRGVCGRVTQLCGKAIGTLRI